MSRTNPLKSISASGIILFLLLAISFMIGKGAKSNVNLDMYLRLGLDQCYTSLYSKLHPEKKISTMVEFGEITAGVFGPGGFRDACMQNPKEAVKYLALNGVINSIILVPGLIRHRSLFVPESYGKKGEIIQILLFILIFMTGTILGIKEHISKPFLKNLLRHAKYLLFKNNLIILFILASSSSAAIVLLISDPRYWISFIPLVFVWIAWSIDCIALKFQKSSFLIPIALIVIIILCHPMFLFSKSNQALIFKMRNTVAEHQVKTPVVAGLYPSSLPVFAFKNDHRTVNVDEFSTVAVAEGKYDFIAIDTYFRNSSFWAKNMGFMDGFEKNPDKYKYKLIGTTDDKHILSVYARKE
ncbi:MAG: hypothetical protein WCP55_13045 [Lentisphaerota bacterium]